MSDTPETDAEWNGREAQDYSRSEFVVPLDLARRLERERDKAKHEAAYTQQLYVSAIAEKDATIAELRAEVERLRKDAERYRWLRDYWKPDCAVQLIYRGFTNEQAKNWCAEVNKAIDDAIAKERGE